MELQFFVFSLFFSVLQFYVVIATQEELHIFRGSNLHNPPNADYKQKGKIWDLAQNNGLNT